MDNDIIIFGETDFRNQKKKFGIKLDDRRRHVYIIGKTGTGKTTLAENMAIQDIQSDRGVGIVDPHGEFAEKMLDFVPANRINDVIYFNPADLDFPIAFNVLEKVSAEHRHLVASGLMGVFKKIWPDVWSARMEYILNNTLLALLEFPNTTLLGINRLLADDAYRKRVIKNLKDPVIRSFWETEFAGYNDRYKQEAVAPVQNKIGQFLSASVIRNIVAQVKSRINIREIMDTKKIFIMNLSKGRIGEDNSRLLGGMLITKIQLAAMERVDTPEKERKDFFLYVDEFQNFATESFSNILSEARKYRLDLTMAHQYMEQLSEEVLAAVIGNVGTLVTFRVGSTDAEILAKEFAPTFIETDLVNLTKFQIYLKLMIDGVASQPFSANTLSPINLSTNSAERVIKVSRERYATSRENIEDKIMRWTGMEAGGNSDTDNEDDEGYIKEPTPRIVAENKNPELSKAKDSEYTTDEEGMPVKIEKKVFPPSPTPSPVCHAPQVIQKLTPPPVKSNTASSSSDIKNSKPVSLVDTNQKGISLSQAVQTNKQPVKSYGGGDRKSAPSNLQRPKQTPPNVVRPTQNQLASTTPKKVESSSAVVQPSNPPLPRPSGELPKPLPRNEPEKTILPDKIVKIDDGQN